MKTSARNMFVGQISSIRQGMVVCEVELTTSSGLKIVSAITKESLETLGLAQGNIVKGADPDQTMMSAGEEIKRNIG